MHDTEAVRKMLDSRLMEMLRFFFWILLAAIPGVSAFGAEAVEPKTYGGISYVSGGIGEGERTAMRSLSTKYNLWLWFADRRTGANLSDVNVTVEDKKGSRVLDVVSDGPWLMARVPAGRYKVSVTRGGAVQIHSVAVGVAARSPTLFRLAD